jgi:hypothetical protein
MCKKRATFLSWVLHKISSLYARIITRTAEHAMTSQPCCWYCRISEKYTIWGHKFARNYVLSAHYIALGPICIWYTSRWFDNNLALSVYAFWGFVIVPGYFLIDIFALNNPNKPFPNRVPYKKLCLVWLVHLLWCLEMQQESDPQFHLHE